VDILVRQALMIGNSDGIGLAATKRLLTAEWNITGVSKSESPIINSQYSHHVVDVSDRTYPEMLHELLQENPIDLCIYFAGIGELLDFKDMSGEPKIIDVNLTGMVSTAAAVIPKMVETGKGHFIGISSLADDLLSAEAPSYHASKAGFSNYLGGLALALKPSGVFVTNVRFGFVDTKMAKGDVKPLMMSVEKAVDHLQICIEKKPICYTAPRIAIPLVKFRKLMMRLGGQ
jgi:short-subunit dehydrogenase